MHDNRRRDAAREAWIRTHSLDATAREAAVSLSTARRWLLRGWPTATNSDRPCPICEGPFDEHDKRRSYAYLLGQYLGDGHLVTSTRVPVLRIYTADAYPGIRTEVDESIVLVSGRTPGHVRASHGSRMAGVQSYWMHWPCLLPQHGPGRKHERPIVLAGWQQQLVQQHPWPLIRGLIHSDGCRSINRVTVHGKTYAYPRYLFANESRDIMRILQNALDHVGVDWRMNRPNSLSIARRQSVTTMDNHIGPKT